MAINRAGFLMDTYTDIVNTHGVGSKQANAFRQRHVTDTKLLRLANIIDRTAVALLTGTLS